MVAHVGVVAGQDEDGVLKPRLTTGSLEKTTDGHIGIADAFLYWEMFLGEALFVLVRYGEGMVAGGCEDSCHEGLLEFRHLLGIVLQERLVPDGPGAVEVVGAS